MADTSALRIQPAEQVVGVTRSWLQPVREALGPGFVAAYLTGSVLTQGFDPRRSAVNLLVVVRALDAAALDTIAGALPRRRAAPAIEPLFVTRGQIEASLDSFPIEWLEIQERHLLLDGADVFENLEVPRTSLRLQCEHELRAKHIQLRQAYLLHHGDGRALAAALKASASGFATLFRTLLRLRNEVPPAETARVVERVADLYGLHAGGLLVAHLHRYATRGHPTAETMEHYRRFMAEVERLVGALDELKL